MTTRSGLGRWNILLVACTLFCGGWTQALAGENNLAIIWQSQPGVEPSGYWLDDFASLSEDRLDADGDGHADLILTRRDENGALEAVRVVDASTGQALVDWLLEQAGVVVTESTRFLGFTDPDGNGERDGIFLTGQDVFLLNSVDDSILFQSTAPDELRGIADLTGDGIEEIILYDPQQQIVTVLGARNAS